MLVFESHVWYSEMMQSDMCLCWLLLYVPSICNSNGDIYSAVVLFATIMLSVMDMRCIQCIAVEDFMVC